MSNIKEVWICEETVPLHFTCLIFNSCSKPC